MKVIWNNSFKRSFRKIIKKNPHLKDCIRNILISLGTNPFTPSLKSHKLGGELNEYWSCSVTYDCRIIFIFSQDHESEETLLILVHIGIHDDVY